MQIFYLRYTVWALAIFLIAGCSKNEITPNYKRAQAVIKSSEDRDIRGVVTFIETEDGVRVIAEVKGLVPGKHGFHIHEFGDCSASDFSSAGRLYNPDNHPHAGPDDSPRKAGDLGNIDAKLNGWAYYDRVDLTIALDGPESIVGKSVIIHRYRDDYISQPEGNAGERIACGVIEAVEE